MSSINNLLNKPMLQALILCGCLVVLECGDSQAQPHSSSQKQNAQSQPKLRVARKIAEFDPYEGSSMKDYADRLAAELKNNPDTRGYIIFYHPDSIHYQPGKDHHAEKNIIAAVGIPENRIKAINGGYRKEFEMEMWIVPRGAPAPAASPAPHHKDVNWFGLLTRENDQMIAANVPVSTEWFEIKPETPLKGVRREQTLIVDIDNFTIDAGALGQHRIKLSDGTIAKPEVQLEFDDGTTYLVEYTEAWGAAIDYSIIFYCGVPKGRVCTRIRIRADKPFKASSIRWRDQNPIIK